VAISLSVLGGTIAGALYGFIPGVLKAYTGAHEVVTTIMLNYIAIQIIAYLITGPFRAPGASFARSQDVGNAALPIIVGVAGHVGILLPFLAVPFIWWLLYRSTLGFEIRTVGANPDAALYAGMRPRRLVVFALTFGGLMAGLAGSIEILGVSRNMPAAYSTNIGFDAITVALLGRAHPVGILLGGLLLGAMRAGAGVMQIEAGIPVQMIDLLQGVILFFLAADLIVRRVLRMRAPSAGVEELQTVTRSYGGQTTTP
jgi:simple sugar transport system permease protein